MSLVALMVTALAVLAGSPAPDTGAGPDADGDGHVDAAAGGDDCNDQDPSVHPGAEERWYDGVDQDCDGNDTDRDGDGWPYYADCDDQDPDAWPGAPGWTEDCLQSDDPPDATGAPDGRYTGGCGGGRALLVALGPLLAGLRRRPGYPKVSR